MRSKKRRRCADCGAAAEPLRYRGWPPLCQDCAIARTARHLKAWVEQGTSA